MSETPHARARIVFPPDTRIEAPGAISVSGDVDVVVTGVLRSNAQLLLSGDARIDCGAAGAADGEMGSLGGGDVDR